MHARFCCWVLPLLIGGCTATPESPARVCQNDLFVIDAQFEGGEFDYCRFSSADSVELTFHPEDDKVDSAFSWFSFRVTAKEARDLDINLRFPDAYARYWPKLSTDGHRWIRADENAVQIAADAKSLNLRLPVPESGIWVAAQELITLPYYRTWLSELAAHEDITTSVIGMSIQDRPIHLARTANKSEVVLLLGRQHPPEVPGALAMREFVDVVLAGTDLARAFRDRYALLIIPLLNPDGVAGGHSRHNAGGVDLNRDWGPFTQPETRSVAKILANLDELGIQPRLMLDFHATKETPTMIFYTQVPADDTNPPLFATKWLTRVDERVDDYDFTHDPRTPSGLDNTKNYFFLRYNIPAITFEIGDEADREKVERYTPVFAEEMMQVMLEAD